MSIEKRLTSFRDWFSTARDYAENFKDKLFQLIMKEESDHREKSCSNQYEFKYDDENTFILGITSLSACHR